MAIKGVRPAAVVGGLPDTSLNEAEWITPFVAWSVLLALLLGLIFSSYAIVPKFSATSLSVDWTQISAPHGEGVGAASKSGRVSSSSSSSSSSGQAASASGIVPEWSVGAVSPQTAAQAFDAPLTR